MKETKQTPMTHSEKLQAVREACISANPDVVDMTECGNCGGSGTGVDERGREGDCEWCDCGQVRSVASHSFNVAMNKVPVTLADVLHAIGKDKRIEYRMATMTQMLIGYDGKHYIKGAGHCLWNLPKPLEEQSEETIIFIYTLLHD